MPYGKYGACLHKVFMVKSLGNLWGFIIVQEMNCTGTDDNNNKFYANINILIYAAKILTCRFPLVAWNFIIEPLSAYFLYRVQI